MLLGIQNTLLLNSTEQTVGDITDKVTTLIEVIWIQSLISIVTHIKFFQLIRAYQNKYINI